MLTGKIWQSLVKDCSDKGLLLRDMPINCTPRNSWYCYSWLLNDTDVKKECQRSCSPVKVSYNYRFTLEIVPEYLYSQIGCNANSTGFRLMENVVKRTTIKQVPKMNSLDLLGIVGGHLGLCVGISLTTIFEFLELILDCVFQKLGSNLKRNAVGEFGANTKH